MKNCRSFYLFIDSIYPQPKRSEMIKNLNHDKETFFKVSPSIFTGIRNNNKMFLCHVCDSWSFLKWYAGSTEHILSRWWVDEKICWKTKKTIQVAMAILRVAMLFQNKTNCIYSIYSVFFNIYSIQWWRNKKKK